MQGRNPMVWWTLLFAGLICLIVIMADLGNLPRFLRHFYAFPGGDKVGHFLLMGGLGFLITMSLPVHRVASRPILVVFTSFALALVITLEEVSQAWFATRTFSLADLACSYGGVLSLSFAAYIWQCRRAGKEFRPECATVEVPAKTGKSTNKEPPPPNPPQGGISTFTKFILKNKR